MYKKPAETYRRDKPCKKCGEHERTIRHDVCIFCRRKGANSGYHERQTIPRHRLNRSFYAAKARAAEKGMDFSIEIDQLALPKTCPVFGTPLTTPSLDRHDSGKGYTVENTRVISWRANQLKSNGTLEEFEKLVAYLRKG